MARAGFGFKVEGLAQVVRDLQAIGLQVDDLKDAFSAIAAAGARAAAGFVHSQSGRLAGGLRGNTAKGKAGVTAGSAAAEPNASPQNYSREASNSRGQDF